MIVASLCVCTAKRPLISSAGAHNIIRYNDGNAENRRCSVTRYATEGGDGESIYGTFVRIASKHIRAAASAMSNHNWKSSLRRVHAGCAFLRSMELRLKSGYMSR